MTDSIALKRAIRMSGYTQEEVAKMIGMTSACLSYKINNKRGFYVSEVEKLVKVLNIKKPQSIFFASGVE